MGADALADTQLARDVAMAAGTLLQRLRKSASETGKALGARADAEANTLILQRLRAARPDDMILSEEARDDKARCHRRRVWVVDPLDGTREYAEGRDDFAVHIALAVDCVATLGAVGLPAQARVLDSASPPSLTPPQHPPRIVASRSRTPPEARAVAHALHGELMPMGSAGAKAMAVVDGRADAYIHSGGQFEWDSCAPVAVARAAGLHCSRLDGTPLIYNCEDVYLPDLLICHPGLAETILTLLREIEPAKGTSE